MRSSSENIFILLPSVYLTRHRLSSRETVRQINNIKASQEHELQAIEDAQKAQFVEFSNAWDKYMSDYEATALQSIEKLKVHAVSPVGEARGRARRDAQEAEGGTSGQGQVLEDSP